MFTLAAIAIFCGLIGRAIALHTPSEGYTEHRNPNMVYDNE